MKICAYVQEEYTKSTYKNECMDVRQFYGLRIIIDMLNRAGYEVDYAGIATVHEYDVVLVSITAFCDWWSFIRERQRWQKGSYKVLVGGAGCLNVEPFLPWFYAAMLGRGEDLIVPLVDAIKNGDRYDSESIVYSDTFSNEKIYRIKQSDTSYQHPIQLYKGEPWQEGKIGCNHRCLFCSYTYSRKQNFSGAFSWDGKGGTVDMSDKECALLDYRSGEYTVNFSHIRTTAIDGCSERIRFGVGKKIPKDVIVQFLIDASNSDATPHLIRFFNIVGYPTESIDDYMELLETFIEADKGMKAKDKKWLISMQENPFIPYPATPMACAPMMKKDFHGGIIKALGLKGEKHRLFTGNAMDLLESWTIEGLPTIAMNAIVARGEASDTESFAKISASKKFDSASKAVKIATLERYFDLDKIFGSYTPETLPTRWLRTWCAVEKTWGKTPLERGKND